MLRHAAAEEYNLSSGGPRCNVFDAPQTTLLNTRGTRPNVPDCTTGPGRRAKRRGWIAGSGGAQHRVSAIAPPTLATLRTHTERGRTLFPLQGLGVRLSDGDVEGVKAALEEFLVRALLPALQQRVRSLHFQVTTLTLD